MPQQHESLAVTPGNSRIRDLEGIGFDPAAVILFDRDLGDLRTCIGEKLLTGGGQLGEVLRESGNDGPQCPGGDPAPGDGELGSSKLVLLRIFLQLRADNLDARAETATNSVKKFLTTHTPRVPKHEVRVIGRRL